MPARRVNRSLLMETQDGTEVRFVGRVEGIDNGRLTLEAPDGGEVFVALQPGATPPQSKYIEVIGTVDSQNLTIRQNGFLFELGHVVDLALCNEIIKLSMHPQFRALYDPIS
eukprot:Trichotokara_eunicae@DN3915_c0_g1_i3.p1